MGRDVDALGSNQYAKFADERSRPFYELTARVRAEAPHLVVDLGCGNGPLTLALAQRWPDARVVGVDSSQQMLDAAHALDPDGRVEWIRADLAVWDIDELGARPDVIVTNAVLQWIPNHLKLLPTWVDALAPGGWLALQVPGNFSAPSHRLMREVAARQPRAGELLAALERGGSAEPATYLQLLTRASCVVDAWETTYLHLLDPAGSRAIRYWNGCAAPAYARLSTYSPTRPSAPPSSMRMPPSCARPIPALPRA